jgi:predicted nucleotidyltransferase
MRPKPRNRQNRSWQGHGSAVTFAEMKLEFDVEAVRQFCQERGIARLELFGSALRDDFDSDSDVDLLASIRPGVKCGLFEWVDWQEGLARIFSRRVDLVSRRAVERSRNPYRKHSILSHTKPIYVEGQRLLA